MPNSMTGYASRKGQGLGHSWLWDLRSVNGKGLDLRLRVPDWIDGLEQAIRAGLGPVVTRGNIGLTLKLSRDEEASASGIRLNAGTLRATLAAIAEVHVMASASGVPLAPPNAADLLSLRGVMDMGNAEVDTAALRVLLIADLAPLLASFQEMRAVEGQALARLMAGQLETIEALTADARVASVDGRDAARAALQASLSRVLDNSEGVDETRLAQELAMLAVKSDVTEELDRLTAHVAAARSLLAEPGATGRKFDFLMQEFMREANTLCSKAQTLALTRIGLDLKTVIDQMREQGLNVE